MVSGPVACSPHVMMSRRGLRLLWEDDLHGRLAVTGRRACEIRGWLVCNTMAVWCVHFDRGLDVGLLSWIARRMFCQCSCLDSCCFCGSALAVQGRKGETVSPRMAIPSFAGPVLFATLDQSKSNLQFSCDELLHLSHPFGSSHGQWSWCSIVPVARSRSCSAPTALISTGFLFQIRSQDLMSGRESMSFS